MSVEIREHHFCISIFATAFITLWIALEMQTLRPHLRSTESETRKEGEVEVGAKICILISAPGNDGLDEV